MATDPCSPATSSNTPLAHYHPTMDLAWRDAPGVLPERTDPGWARRAIDARPSPPAPRGHEAKTPDRIERPRHTNTAVAASAAGRASVPTRRTAVPRGASPGRTATA